MHRRTFLSATAATASLLATDLRPAMGADWQPRRPINLIVPYAPGGGVDSYARALTNGLREQLGKPMVVVNKGGAGGMTGAAEAAAAAPDGETLMLAATGGLLLGSMFRPSPIDPLTDFTSVAQVGNLVFAVAVPVSSPYKSGADLVAAIKAAPGKMRWAHGGRGSATHVPGQSFLDMNGLVATDVPFQGGAEIRAAIVGAQVDFGVIGIQQQAGFESQMRILGVFDDKRYALMPDLPTFDEQNIPTGNIGSPVSVLAPKELPETIVTVLEAAFKRAALEQEFAEMLAPQGLVPDYLPGPQAEAKLRQIQQAAEPIFAAMKKG